MKKKPYSNIMFDADDFYFDVEEALELKQVEDFLAGWYADPNLKLRVSEKPVIISPYAFYESESGKNSLEDIFIKAYKLHKEIPFTGIINEKKLEVSEFIKGTVGIFGLCDWQKGPLLKNSYRKAKEQTKKVSLGHTHPHSFGAICSQVKWTRKHLLEFIKKGDEIAEIILENELYQKYGGDYSILFTSAQTNSLISKFSWILSPREYKMGVFEIEKDGVATYHPWKIGD